MAANQPTDGLDPPELLLGLNDWYAAFFELSTDRQIGAIAGPIPASSISRHTAGWPEEDAEAFRVCMRAMDAAYLAKPEDAPDPEFAGSTNPARDAFRAAHR